MHRLQAIMLLVLHTDTAQYAFFCLQALCSAPYRAPELYDVPSPGTITPRIDTWSLGCTLYYLMYGVSPFERVLNEAGGSLALAVVK